MIIGTSKKGIGINRRGITASDVILVAAKLENLSFPGDIPILNKCIVAGGNEVKLVVVREMNESNGTSVGSKTTDRITGFDVDDLNETGEVRGGDEAGVVTVRNGRDGVFEGGDRGSRGECFGTEYSDGGRVGGGERVR